MNSYVPPYARLAHLLKIDEAEVREFLHQIRCAEGRGFSVGDVIRLVESGVIDPAAIAAQLSSTSTTTTKLQGTTTNFTHQAARPEPDYASKLWPWQGRALEEWTRRGGRGVVEAVTGSGKTHVGLAAAARHLASGTGTKVGVLVTTRDLQQQWRRMFNEFLPQIRVGLLSGTFKDNLTTCDLLIATVQTACKQDILPASCKGLLIADECHHYGAEKWSTALEEGFKFRLGLTAVYERDDDGIADTLDPYFGGVCYTLEYKAALTNGVIAPFKIAFLGVEWTRIEALEYERINEVCNRAKNKLVNSYEVEPKPFAAFMKNVKRLADLGNDAASRTATTFQNGFWHRKKILAEAEMKPDRLGSLAEAVKASQRTIIFTGTKAAAKRAANVLSQHGINAKVIDADVPPAKRPALLQGFESGKIKALVAPQILNEGIDVPAADLAIVIAASRSKREMIQRLGRVLRTKTDGPMARLVVLYVQGTPEDPHGGAHETFIDVVKGVAEDVRYFDPERTAMEICSYLNDWVAGSSSTRSS